MELKAEVSVGPHPNGGIAAEFHFPNGYGASVIKTSFSYGVELAVLRRNGDAWPIIAEPRVPECMTNRGVVPFIRTEDELRRLLTAIALL